MPRPDLFLSLKSVSPWWVATSLPRASSVTCTSSPSLSRRLSVSWRLNLVHSGCSPRPTYLLTMPPPQSPFIFFHIALSQWNLTAVSGAIHSLNPEGSTHGFPRVGCYWADAPRTLSSEHKTTQALSPSALPWSRSLCPPNRWHWFNTRGQHLDRGQESSVLGAEFSPF